jgi:glycosyltransferase involved in cell wall biosynthesis
LSPLIPRWEYRLRQAAGGGVEWPRRALTPEQWYQPMGRTVVGVAHEVWLSFPKKVRRPVFHGLSALVAPRPDPAAKGGLPLAVAGLFRAATGIGEGARRTFDALEAAGLEPAAFDLSGAFDDEALPESSGFRPMVEASGGSLIVHISGAYLPYALCVIGHKRTKARRIIGYWAWELPQIPKAMRIGLRFAHEIWVPSSFVRDAVAPITDIPVHVVPHPLPAMNASPLPRSNLGLPDDAVVILSVAHLGSTLNRKNPLAVIKAFRQAYGDTNNRILLLKLLDPGTVDWARRSIEECIGGAANIRVIDRTLTDREMVGLIAMADIVVSLHRSEGFGLVPAQAMRLGKPVIATGWSGNLDFMTKRNSALVSYRLVTARDPQGTYDFPNQNWADPNVEHAAAWIRRLGESAELRQRLGSQAAGDLTSRFAPELFARRVRGLLQRGDATL